MAQDAASNILAFLIVLGFLIFAHESGHFMVAKLFRVRVLVFSFGFGKRLFGFKKGDTDYRVSLIPLGGYVRMAGDTPDENVSANPDEFLSKPKWQRFLILFAGPAMNVIIAILFLAFLPMIGIEQNVIRPVILSVEPKTPAAKAGLQAGDRIVGLRGERVEDYSDVRVIISMSAGTPIEVAYLRDGALRKTTLTPARADGDFGPVGRAGFSFGSDPIVGRVTPQSPASAAGIRAGDRILSVNGKPIQALEGFYFASNQQKTGAVTIDVLRGSQSLTVRIPAAGDDKLAISRGIVPQTTMLKLGFLSALRYSVAENWKMLRMTGVAVRRLFRPEGSVRELSGPINIARISGETMREAGPIGLIGLMAMISLQLGVMNLLPIPVLDGGHIMILLIEGVARRNLSLHVKERIQQVGFALLATLMIVVIYNDVISNVLRVRNG